ncbi:unnamed protein product [Urochloa humidicola]
MAYITEKSHRSTYVPKRMSLQLLNEVTNDFSEKRKLGSGTYGDVYKAILNGKEVAVKVLRHLNPIDDYHEKFMGEFENLWRLRHQNIVQLLGYCYETKSEYVDSGNGRFVFAEKIYTALCLEYMHKRSLRDHLYDECNGHDWQTRYKIIKGICEGLKYLHEGLEIPMYHLDLKPENILLDKAMVPKIGDFGLSRLVQDDQTNATVQSSVGTSGYMPPEYIDNDIISKKFDIFSLGVVMIRIITGYEGYHKKDGMSSQEFVELVCENWRNRPEVISGGTPPEDQCHQVKRCIEIALDCVHANAIQRPAIGDIIRRLNNYGSCYSSTKELVFDSSSVEFSSLPVPKKLPSSSAGRGALDVVNVFAFDCREYSSAWYTVVDIFWMVQEKLSDFVNSRISYIYFMNGNTYTWDTMLVDSAETKATGDTEFAGHRLSCTENMASGLAEAHKMISSSLGYRDGIILFFSDGLVNKGDFFDGTEDFISKVPVHTFTLGADAYNQGLHAIAANSPGGKFHTVPPVPQRPHLSAPFSRLLDSILGHTTLDDEKPYSPSSSGKEPLDVVIVYAFDCTCYTPAWYTVDDGVFWLVQEKLTQFVDSCMGFIYPELKSNTYTSDMKLVDSAETRTTGYMRFACREIDCTKDMASGLAEAHKMISNRGYKNGIILFFSDGLINKGDFFDGTENFISNVPVHTFTLGGDAYNHGLHVIATNSPGGKFHNIPIPERPNLSEPFIKLLDSILGVTTLEFDDGKPPSPISGEPLDVVLVFAFDCSDYTSAWYTVVDIFWMVHEKLIHFVDSCMGYIYFMLDGNTYTSDMKLVDSAEKTDDTEFAGHTLDCTKSMASGLAEAHKMISNRGYKNGTILFFSDGLINEGDFFDGTENFISKVPVHAFTLGGDAYNHVLQAIVANSPHGTFNPLPVPKRPRLSARFSKLLDSLLRGTMTE